MDQRFWTLGCTAKRYPKPAKKPVVPSSYEVLAYLWMYPGERYDTHTLTRLDLTDTQTANVEAICASQEMPSWGAFNSIVTEEDIPVKAVGFLPVLPHPVTDHEIVFTSIHNLLNVPNQLGQSYPPVFCDAFFTLPAKSSFIIQESLGN